MYDHFSQKEDFPDLEGDPESQKIFRKVNEGGRGVFRTAGNARGEKVVVQVGDVADISTVLDARLDVAADAPLADRLQPDMYNQPHGMAHRAHRTHSRCVSSWLAASASSIQQYCQRRGGGGSALSVWRLTWFIPLY